MKVFADLVINEIIGEKTMVTHVLITRSEAIKLAKVLTEMLFIEDTKK